MDSEPSAFAAANQRHHRYMVFGKKQRYIEVFQCSGEDMSMVLTGGVGGPGAPPAPGKSPLISPGMLHVPPASVPPAQLAQQYIADPLLGPLPQLAALGPPQLLLGQGQVPGVPSPFAGQMPGVPVSAAQLTLPPRHQTPMVSLPPGWDMTGNVPVMTYPLSGPSTPTTSLPSHPPLRLPRLVSPQPMPGMPNPFAPHMLSTPRYLLPPQTAYPRLQPPPGLVFPQVAPPQIGGKRSSDQAFGAENLTSFSGLLPPKRPPVMYSHGSAPPALTPPSTSVGHLLPNPTLPLPPGSASPFPSV